MPLTEEQAKQIKQQLLQQLDKFPEEQRNAAKQQIDSMSTEELEQFLNQNNLVPQKPQVVQPQGKTAKYGKEQCIFCSIADGKISSFKLDENKQAIAVLEINPMSVGHTIILPKEHTAVEQIPKAALSLAKKFAKKIKSKLKPREVEISTSNMQGHTIVNIIPIYNDIPNERKKAEESQLKQLQSLLQVKPRKKAGKKKIKSEAEQKLNLPKAPRRIP